MSESEKALVPSVVNKMDEVLQMMNLPMDHDENFNETPKRFLKYLQHYTQMYDPETDLGVTFPLARKPAKVEDRAMVVQVGIPYRAVCAHHLLPVLGTAHVGYIPRDRVVGLSKLSRVVYGFSHALPSLQEDVCDAVTEALRFYLEPVGAMCVIEAEHGCMAARGVEEATGCIQTVTSSIKGIFVDNYEAREEFYHLVQRGS